MLPRRLAVAVLVLLGLATATLEESFVHADDGCVLETHCQACLLKLGTPGVVGVVFSLPRALAATERVAPTPLSSYEGAAPRALSSRGPPSA
ncbi:MAG: hypothetical protein ACM3PV_12350, partial [Betaproteobacteria bacterium]